MQLVSCHGSDSPKLPHRERVEKLQLSVRFDNQKTIGLGHATSDLGQELGSCHPDRDCQPDLVEHPLPQPAGHYLGLANETPEPRYIQKCLIYREPLHQRAGLVEDLEHPGAGHAVGTHSGLDHDRIGTKFPGLPGIHRRTNTPGLGFVATRQHHSAAHQHRSIPQLWPITLLY